jgi:hypothetical protein
MPTDELNDLLSNEVSLSGSGDRASTARSEGFSNRSSNEPLAQAPLRSDDRRRERRASLDVFANRFLEGHPYVLTASGEIVFEDPAERTLGIRFTHLSTAAAGAIDRFLQRCQQG